MKRSFLIVAICLAFRCSAQTVKIDDIDWSYSVSDGSVTILGASPVKGEMTIPGQIDGLPVRSIGESAFYSCIDITKIHIPDGLQKIGHRAFCSCRNLEEIEFPGSLKEIGADAFFTCYKIRSIVLPDSLEKLGGGAFSDCISLESVDCVETGNPVGSERSDKSIGPGVFSNCILLRSVEIPKGINNFNQYGGGYREVFSNNPNLEKVIITTGNICEKTGLENCENLRDLTLPSDLVMSNGFAASYQSITNIVLCDGATGIRENAFAGCRRLRHISIPDSVKKIGKGAFDDCPELGHGVVVVDDCAICINEPYQKDLVIPEGVRLIAAGICGMAPGIVSLRIPNSVTDLGEDVTSGCDSLEEITIASAVETMASSFPSIYRRIKSVVVHEGVKNICVDMFKDCTSLENVVMSEGVTNIATRAFEFCSSLRNIKFPTGLIAMGPEAFFGCAALERVELPDMLLEVPQYAFYECTNIRELIIGRGVADISGAAFFNCAELRRVVVTSNVRTIGVNAFAGCTCIDEVKIEDLESWGQISFGNEYANPCWPGVHFHVNGCELEKLELDGDSGVVRGFAYCGCKGVKELVLNEGICSVGECAFKNCEALERVNIPSTLTRSEYGAFSGCPKIRHAEFRSFPNAHYLYSGPIEKPLVNGLYPGINVHVHSGEAMRETSVTVCGPINYTFYWKHKRSLGDNESFVLILDNTPITSIDDLEWQRRNLNITDGFHTITWRQQNFGYEELIGYNYTWVYPRSPTYPGEVAIPYRAAACLFPDSYERLQYVECGTDVPDWYFSSCSGLVSCVVKEGVCDIGEGALHNCKSIRAFAIPNSVSRIGKQAFKNCDNMMSCAVGSGLETVGERAWQGCVALDKFEMPSSVTNVGKALFEGCVKLSEISFAGNPPLHLFDAMNGQNGAAVICREKYRQEFADNLPSGTELRVLPVSVIFEPPSGTCFDSALKIVASSDVEGADVRYTVDGSNPGVNSSPFKKLTITSKTTIKAIAVLSGQQIGAVSTATYGTGKVATPIIWGPEDCAIGAEGASVLIKCDTPNANIKYTLDGSDPRVMGQDYRSGFRITETTLVRAVAVGHPDFIDSDESIVMFERRWERLDAPECSMADGDVFYHSKQEVLLWSGREGVDIRYTLDGSTPTEESPICNGHISVSETVTLKFAAFKTGYLPSETTTIHLTREWLAVADPVISAPESFTGRRTVATIASATEGARIYYTTDGSTPTTASKEYSGSIEILGTMTIRAIAVKEDWLNSGVVSASVEKVWSIGDALNLSGWPFSCSGSSPWMVCRSESYDGEASMISGDIGRNETSELRMQVTGPGTLSFWWKASCEWTGSPDILLYDAGEFFVDGTRRSYIQGFTDWVKVEVSVDGTGPHEFVWRYSKDGSDSEGEDCVWLDCVSWTGSPKIEDAVMPSSITGGNEDLTVNGSWVTTDLVERYGEGKDIAFCEMYGSDLSAALLKPTGKKDARGNPLFVWQDYVAGTDPTDPNSLFRVSVEMVDGRPVITWDPNLNENGVCRVYTIYGKYELSDAKWHTPTNGLSRFFKVGVSMPGQGGSTGEEDPQDGEEGLLLHRWSFNGNLLDSVGGSDAVAVGSVTQGAREYTLAGGMSGSSYIDLGDDLLPTDGSAVTIEMWATMRSLIAGWTRIWQFGDMPQGFEFSSYNISVYSENYIGMCWNGMSKFSCDDGGWDDYSWTSFTTDKEAYLSVVYAPNGDGSWTVSYRHIDVASGETINQHSFSTKGSDWSLASVGQSECLLGQALTCWDACANASYNEVRIWNRALSEAEQKAHVAAGPDAVLVK